MVNRTDGGGKLMHPIAAPMMLFFTAICMFAAQPYTAVVADSIRVCSIPKVGSADHDAASLDLSSRASFVALD